MAQRAMKQHLDGSLAALHRLRSFEGAESCNDAQTNDFGLLICERPQPVHKPLDFQMVVEHVFWRRFAADGFCRAFPGQIWFVCAQGVNHPPARDAEQLGCEGAFMSKMTQVRVSSQECLRGDVFGVLLVPDPRIDVAIDPRDVTGLQRVECGWMAKRCPRELFV
jgi:hypothetical protein